nr:unnamed protein product [Digitaria exilis]
MDCEPAMAGPRAHAWLGASGRTARPRAMARLATAGSCAELTHEQQRQVVRSVESRRGIDDEPPGGDNELSGGKR